MSTFTLLLGGELVRTPRLDIQTAGTRVIAADSGIRHADMLGLLPELWVGDFDSAPANLPPHLAKVPQERFPAEKDKTDGELAVAIARQSGATKLILVGAFGGARADHAFLHLALAVRLAEEGIDVLLTSGAQEGVPLLPGHAARFDYADDTLFSVLGFSELTGLTIKGAKWPLNDIEMAFGSSLTISNAVKGELEISFGSGRALLLAHPFPLPET
ncbi:MULTISPECIES: thiamine diphosphokinase [Phyllobacteriaceae]|jgi:thiamine pyrophosphokinase|uniref:Thiamine diphosphokinase n=1 Tax=Mesorhizobium hungaricum TaxID=1566387 RepID=A0A1C2DFG5_9HYPH|nr:MULTISPECIES: thiamine diphosphokinase [Mesorhizobium]MBN9232486.1 thiamine diphosphokinase [Mesorhizobium sp.]MDQ0330083.1 thiamine pyrophosphokinase [Mesorhizobium sp. YL-MeA3-2017]OCX13376.1 thiamine diphosphokinase [Mesorhizobium hungaricum]